MTNLGVSTISEQAFYDTQKNILQPVIEKRWVKEREAVIEELVAAGTPLTIAGDGRADSPGHSAKFGVYTGLETNINKIVDFELVQVCNTKSLLYYAYFNLCKFYTYF